MRNKENILQLLEYIQDKEGNEFQFDEEAILSSYHQNKDNQSLAIKILSIFGGLLASLAFLGFLFIAGLYNSDFGLLFFGICCIVGAIWINKAYDKILIDTVSVSSFIIGFILIRIGLNMLEMDENTISLLYIIIAVFSLIIVQNYILSFVSILILNGSILNLIISNKDYELIHIYVSALALITTYVFLKEAKLVSLSKALSKLYHSLRVALIFSFLSGLVILGKKGILPLSPDIIWISSVINISAILYLLSQLFKLLNISSRSHKAGIYILSVLLLLPTILSPAISGAILILLLGFLVNYKTALVIGVIAFIYFISQFYYDLNFTLHTKSILLFSSGILFIALYLFTNKKLTS